MSKIQTITISRSMSASTVYGMRNNVEIYVHKNGKVQRYQTNPILAREGRISAASVLRAKRAQVKLLELAQSEEATA